MRSEDKLIKGDFAEGSEVAFKCRNLIAAIRKALEKPEGAITREDLASMEKLSAEFGGINDLSGLEHAVNLENVWLSNNLIRDIGPLAGLTQLANLYLEENQISDLSPLTNLGSLVSLGLSENQVDDLTPLSGLKSLKKLYLRQNRIKDLSSLANLENLLELCLGENKITDIEPLANLTQLKWRLTLNHNKITDIEPLTNLTELENLRLNDNLIENIFALAELRKLSSLYLENNPIEHFSPLANLKKLEYLEVDGEEAIAPSPLARPCYLYHRNKAIDDPVPLVDLSELADAKRNMHFPWHSDGKRTWFCCQVDERGLVSFSYATEKNKDCYYRKCEYLAAEFDELTCCLAFPLSESELDILMTLFKKREVRVALVAIQRFAKDEIFFPEEHVARWKALKEFLRV